MFNRYVVQSRLAGILALLLVLGSGCTTIRRDVSVNRGKDLPEDASVTVHVVGVNASDLDAWKSESMTSYWDPSTAGELRGKKVASGLVKSITLPQSGGAAKLEESDPIWEQWETAGVTHLLVLSDVPRRAQDRPGSEDQRRRVFELERKSNPRNLVLEVDSTGLRTIKG